MSGAEIELLKEQLSSACSPSAAFDKLASVCLEDGAFEPLLEYKKKTGVIKKLFRKNKHVDRPQRTQFATRKDWLEALRGWHHSDHGHSFEDAIPRDVARMPAVDLKERNKYQNLTRIAVFGLAGSGKTTLLKQLELLFLLGFSEEQALAYRHEIIEQTLSACALLIAVAQQRTPMADLRPLQTTMDVVLCLSPTQRFLPAHVQHVQTLWRSEFIQRAALCMNPAYVVWKRSGAVHRRFPLQVRRAVFQFLLIARRHRLPRDVTESIVRLVCVPEGWRGTAAPFPQNNNCSVSYFLDNSERILDEHYMPTTQDILHCYDRSDRLEELQFDYNRDAVRLVCTPRFDSSETNKWIDQFQDFHAILYIHDLSHPSFEESLNWFHHLASSKWLRNTIFILCLNKLDRFKQMIERGSYPVPSGYRGPMKYEEVLGYLKNEFLKKQENQYSRAYTHCTVMIDTENINHVWASVGDILFRYGGGGGFGGMLLGRPFNVDGEKGVVAPVSSSSVIIDGIPDDRSLNLRQTQRFTRMGQLEHSSIASFSIFALQLLSVGAPFELVVLAHKAALDEIRHARLAFALASRFSGRAVQPDRMDSKLQVTVETGLRAVALSTAREACVGETLSTFAAHSELQAETDEEILACLRTVVADEARHSVLGWRTVKWCLSQDPSLASALRSIFQEVPQIQEFVRWLFSSDDIVVLEQMVARVFRL